MKTKKLSERLIETERRLGVSPDALAFVMGIKYEMYRRYHNGEWDDTYSVRKDKFGDQLDNIDIEIENKIILLIRALRNFYKKAERKALLKTQSKNGKKNVKTLHSNQRNLNGKPANK